MLPGSRLVNVTDGGVRREADQGRDPVRGRHARREDARGDSHGHVDCDTHIISINHLPTWCCVCATLSKFRLYFEGICLSKVSVLYASSCELHCSVISLVTIYAFVLVLHHALKDTVQSCTGAHGGGRVEVQEPEVRGEPERSSRR